MSSRKVPAPKGARTFANPNPVTNKDKTMANDKQKTAPAPAAPAKPAPAAPVPAVAAAPAPAKPTPGDKKPKRAKYRLVSTTIPGLWCRVFVDVVEKHGYPQDPNGVKMVPGKASSFGLSEEVKAARLAAKAAEEAAKASMSDEEKLAYAKAKREVRQAEQAAKKAAERAALIASIKAEIAAGNL